MEARKYVALLLFLAFVQLGAAALTQDRSAPSASPNPSVPKPTVQPTLLAFAHVTVIDATSPGAGSAGSISHRCYADSIRHSLQSLVKTN
jgi:hypothetical protein